jgi:hypothetical protein
MDAMCGRRHRPNSTRRRSLRSIKAKPGRCSTPPSRQRCSTSSLTSGWLHFSLCTCLKVLESRWKLIYALSHASAWMTWSLFISVHFGPSSVETPVQCLPLESYPSRIQHVHTPALLYMFIVTVSVSCPQAHTRASTTQQRNISKQSGQCVKSPQFQVKPASRICPVLLPRRVQSTKLKVDVPVRADI